MEYLLLSIGDPLPGACRTLAGLPYGEDAEPAVAAAAAAPTRPRLGEDHSVELTGDGTLSSWLNTWADLQAGTTTVLLVCQNNQLSYCPDLLHQATLLSVTNRPAYSIRRQAYVAFVRLCAVY